MPVVIEYSAPPACPSEAEFRRAVESRAPVSTFQWRIILRIDKKYAGTLTVERAKEIVLARVLEDQSCADLVTALAIAGALAVSENDVRPNRARKPAPFVPEPVVDVPPPAPVEKVALRAGLSTETTSYLSPSPSYGLGAFGEIEKPGRFFALRARLGFHFATSFPVQVQTASALVSSGFARLELGGVHVRFARILAFRASAIGDVGALVVEGRDILMAQTVTVPFADIGAIARLSWETGLFFVEISGGAVVPLTRPTFFFQFPSRQTAFEVPAVGALGEVGVGLRLF